MATHSQADIIFPVFPAVLPVLLGRVGGGIEQPKQFVGADETRHSDSIELNPIEDLVSAAQPTVIEPVKENWIQLHELSISPSDHRPVTVWQAPPAQILPITDWPQTETLTTSAATIPRANNAFVTFPFANEHIVTSSKANALKTNNRSGRRRALRLALLGIMIISLIVMASVVIPDVYYRLQPESISDVTTGKSELSQLTIEPSAIPTPTPTSALPPVDLSLPTGQWLRISKIGVDAGVLTSANPDEALTKGAWMVPDFGRPNDFSQPTIIASHRYGWLWWWQTDFGRKNSFYYLPDMVPGDEVEVITDQRKYVYEIYAKEEGQNITDYSADLILYTCKYLNSPERYFVYAKRLTSDSSTANDAQPGDTVILNKSRYILHS